MPIQDAQRKIVELYREQELVIADLYERFAGRFPKYADFWTGLASEEREHAGWVEHLLHQTATDSVTFDEGKIRSLALTTSINYVQNLITSFDLAPFDLKKALSCTVDLEKSLIEKNVFDRFSGDSPEVSKLLSILAESQLVHIKAIEKKVAEIRARFAETAR
jgi:rubrerythrin